MKRRNLLTATVALAGTLAFGAPAFAESKEIVYITPSLTISFWRHISTGAEAAAAEAGYTLEALDSNNDAQTQLQNVQDAIAKGVAGIVISPTDSSTAPSALRLAAEAGIPVTIADIGTTEGEFVSFVGSDNKAGAFGIGEVTAAQMIGNGWKDGSYGIIGIPQARINGQLRTQGFRDAMTAAGITNEVPLQEMQVFTPEESFRFAQDMMTANPDLRAIFVQSDIQSIGAQRAVRAARKADDIIVAGFDGTPELLEMIQSGDIIGSGMQQPYLIGFTAAEQLLNHIGGESTEKEILLPILIGTTDNVGDLDSEIRLNVFGGELE